VPAPYSFPLHVPAKALGLPLDDAKDLLAEGPDQLASEMRANALDHARAEVLLGAIERQVWP
jgi:hypothetical protein